jgi:hypothetical protein
MKSIVRMFAAVSIVRMFAAVSIVQIASPAFADNLKLPEHYLQPVEWYHHRPQVQILNTDPIVSDLRRPQEHTVYSINVAPPPQSIIHQININLPSPDASPPGALNTSHPGFTSNILPNSGLVRPLAPGQKTGSLPPLGSLIKQTALKTHAVPLTAARPPAQAQPLTSRYKSETFSGSSNQLVKTEAIGKVLKKMPTR